MLALVNGQLVRSEPVLDLIQGGFSLRADKTRARLFAGSEPIEAGVAFFIRKGKASIHPTSGEFKLESKTATIRAVYAGRHQDLEVSK